MVSLKILRILNKMRFLIGALINSVYIYLKFCYDKYNLSLEVNSLANVVRAKSSSKNIQYLRKINRGKVIEHVALDDYCTRTSLAKSLNLTKMAISKIIACMIAEGLVEEQELNSSQEHKLCGRRPTGLKIPQNTINAIGVRVDRSSVQSISMDINGFAHDFASTAIAADITEDKLMRIIYRQISAIRKKNEDKKYYGIGISCIGPLHVHEGVMLSPPNFYELHNIHFVQYVKEKFGLPCYIDNDMNLGALVEQYYGCAREYAALAYIGYGTGTGSGIIENNNIIHGSKGFACEIGHISMNFYDENKCACGQRGCLELYTNTDFLLKNTHTENLAELMHRCRSEGKKQFEPTLKRFRDAVLFSMVSVVNMYDPDIIVLGGENIQLLDKNDMESLSLQLNDMIFTKKEKHVVVKKTSFDRKTELLGGAALIFKMIMNGKIEI